MVKKNSEDLIFQVIDWDSIQDHDDNVDDDDDSENGSDSLLSYKIRLFGKTSDKRSVAVTVEGYTPFFYVKIPDFWKKHHVEIFINEVKKKVYPKTAVGALMQYDIVSKHDFYGFTNNKLFKFVRLIFKNMDGFRAFDRVFRNKLLFPALGKKPRLYQRYESNIEPMLRCMHIRNLKASGWVKIDKSKYKLNKGKFKNSTCDVELITRWVDLEPYISDTIVPLKILSFDIECESEDGSFPQALRDGDRIIQIGNTFSEYGKIDCFKKAIFTLGSCDPIEGAEVYSFDTEEEMLRAWAKFVVKEDPDVMTGYNIFGFDNKYIYGRSKKHACLYEVSELGRIKNEVCEFVTKKLASSALGDNILEFFKMSGRVQIDLMKVIQRDHKLSSYKLDSVVGDFIREEVQSIEKIKGGMLRITTKSTKGLMNEAFIALTLDDGISKTEFTSKYFVLKMTDTTIDVKANEDDDYDSIRTILDKKVGKLYWAEAKDDVKPAEIFALQKGSSADRAKIAKYCLKDCELVNKLVAKLDILTNNIGMANVCHVPLSYIFLRGQGVKIFSLVSKKCRRENFLIPVVEKPQTDEEEEEVGYEGATVIDPKKGVYFVPIAVLDYSSLYPKSMIERNLSHECMVTDPQYDNLPGYTYTNVTYNNQDGTTTTCRFARKIPEDKKNPLKGTMGIVPQILTELLDERKATVRKAEEEKDPFKKKILDGLQLAYKVTANSLYGQIGARTSPICLKEIAASTTATGRERLHFAKECVESDEFTEFATENFYKNLETDLELNPEKRNNDIEYYNALMSLEDKTLDFKGEVIYGDTDSIFNNFNIKDKYGNLRTGVDGLIIAIRLGMLASKFINARLPPPQSIVYEKTLWPFILVAKKKYVGNLYEKNPKKFYQKSMGIVLKRRDNAPIVKEVVGGVVDAILNKRSLEYAVKYAKESIDKILAGKYPMKKFIISKTLKGNYANPESIAHKVLADRMSIRDPGNKPQLNDRIPYAYIQVKRSKNKDVLQGDLIEHPDYIIKNNLKLDYLFYITNQIMNPTIQFFELMMDKPEKIFANAIQKEINKRMGRQDISKWFEVSIEQKDEIHDNKNKTIFNFTGDNDKKSKKKFASNGSVKYFEKIDSIESDSDSDDFDQIIKNEKIINKSIKFDNNKTKKTKIIRKKSQQTKSIFEKTKNKKLDDHDEFFLTI
jgi:DNA polymerase elongation subunit (family B)